MRPVSAAWGRTITGSHKPLFRATVCDTYQTTTTPTGLDVPILDGDVIVDGTADVRSTLDMLTDGDGMWPRLASDPLAPYGNEIYIERGIEYSDDLVEYVGLGYFRINIIDQDEAAEDEPIQITGQDRMAGIIRGRLLRPRQFGTSFTLGQVVTTLVQEVYPDAVIVWDDDTDDDTLPRSVICEESRFEFLDKLIKGQGKIWYWDYSGQLVIKTAPDPTTSVAELSAGAGGLLMGARRRLSREGAYNAIVMTGEGTDSIIPARGVAIDANPNSPTYYYGRYGPDPLFASSQFVATPGQAKTAADAMLRRTLGLPYTVDLTTVPNPALEPYDSILARFNDRSGSELHVLEQLTIPLNPDGRMSALTREQTLILIGTA